MVGIGACARETQPTQMHCRSEGTQRVSSRAVATRSGAFAMVMVLPFVLGFVAALLAYARDSAMPRSASGLLTVVVQVWWLVYHATDKLAISL